MSLKDVSSLRIFTYDQLYFLPKRYSLFRAEIEYIFEYIIITIDFIRLLKYVFRAKSYLCVIKYLCNTKYFVVFTIIVVQAIF